MIARSAPRGITVAALLSDAFGGHGGIAKFNRDLLRALDAAPQVTRTVALPRFAHFQIDEMIPETVVFDRLAARGKLAYVLRCSKLLARFDTSLDLIICGHINLLPLAWLLARFTHSRLALIIHGIEGWQPTHRFLTDRLAGRVDHVISVSRFSAERFAAWSRIDQDRTFVLPNCVDLRRFQPAERDPRLVERYGLERRRVIMTVGRLAKTERYKGFDEVLTILPRLRKRFPELAYLIVGDGDDRPRLEDRVRSLGLTGAVVFTGRISESEKVAHYNLADLYVMPSSGEGFGIVYLEAAACGVPIIGSRTDGSQEALCDGEIGQLVDPLNLEEVYEAVERMLLSTASRRRHPKLAYFSEDMFRSRFVEWMSRVMDTGGSAIRQ
jgi:phosphatidylinositol alpha-1,6-mannosyltransferase